MIRSASAAVFTLSIILACGGGPAVNDPVARLKGARRMATYPLPEGVPELLSAFDPKHTDISPDTMTFSRHGVRRVRVKIDGRVGSVPFSNATLSYGNVEPDLFGPEVLTPEHVLHEIAVKFIDERCDQVQAFLNETYGPTTAAGAWDGISEIAVFKWRSTGVEGFRECGVWWTHWPPDKQPLLAFKGKTPRVNEVDFPSIAPEYRLEYLRAWGEALRLTLIDAPEAEVEAAILSHDLDPTHRALVRAEIARHVAAGEPEGR